MGLFDFLKRKEFEEIKSLREQLDKFNQITNVEIEIKNRKEEFERVISDMKSELNKKIAFKAEEVKKKENLLKDLNEKYKVGIETYTRLSNEVSLFEDKMNKIECGVYEPIYNFDDLLEYQQESDSLLNKQLQLTLNERTKYLEKTVSSIEMSLVRSVNNSDIELMKFKIHTLMQLAFNSASSNIISKAKWNNMSQLSKQIKKLSKQISDLGSCNLFSVPFNTEFEKLKQDELSLHHDFQLKKQKDKEEERANREALREEEKARKEYEKAQREAEKEEQDYHKSMEKIRKRIPIAKGEEYDQLLLQISQLEQKLLEATQKKERAISMAQQTKRGHVYIISNIGAFGDNVYKIGMTRRLEPLDRVYELGNASVPFHFDVHAMIFSDDAPNLENELHKSFASQKLNMLNNRKEFFKIDINEIERKIKELGIEISFKKESEAIQYRETLAILDRQNYTGNLKTVDEVIKENYPDNLIE